MVAKHSKPKKKTAAKSALVQAGVVQGPVVQEMAPRHSNPTTGITAQVYAAMVAAYATNPAVRHVAAASGVSNPTAQKYIRDGDPARGFPPLRDALAASSGNPASPVARKAIERQAGKAMAQANVAKAHEGADAAIKAITGAVTVAQLTAKTKALLDAELDLMLAKKPGVMRASDVAAMLKTLFGIESTMANKPTEIVRLDSGMTPEDADRILENYARTRERIGRGELRLVEDME